jgi:hypothetical protein
MKIDIRIIRIFGTSTCNVRLVKPSYLFHLSSSSLKKVPATAAIIRIPRAGCTKVSKLSF